MSLQVASIETDGFNYPIGSRINSDHDDVDGWVIKQYFQEDGLGFGLHSGEDWNDECGGDKDVGAYVYAVANGEVFGPSRRFTDKDGIDIGEGFALKHDVPNVGTRYSFYLHIELEGKIRELEVGDTVYRDQVIGKIADMLYGPHLHFEIRQKSIDLEEGGNPWPHGNSHGAYYSDDNSATGEVTRTAEEKMTDVENGDGLLNPSVFIYENHTQRNNMERSRIPSDFLFQRKLNYGMCRYEIRYLQMILNSDPDTRVATTGPGSIGNETSWFWTATQAALIKFQNKYMGIDAGDGVVDDATRTELNRILDNARQNPRVDVVIMIDSSGSMQGNDPSNKRLDAARAYLTGSFAGDYVGIVDFDSQAHIASILRPLPEEKEILINAINTIDSSGGTNIGTSVSAGCNALIASWSVNTFRKGGILLTDGEGSYANQHECFTQNGWPIYTFGLGSGADNELLSKIASETGGEHIELEENEIICEFQRVRSKIAGVEPPPCRTMRIGPFELIVFSIEIKPGQLQTTFSTAWNGSDVEMSLVSPSGRVFDRYTQAHDISHDNGAAFEVYTVTNPEPGEWEITLFGADIPLEGEDVTFIVTSVPNPNQSPRQVQGDLNDDGAIDVDDYTIFYTSFGSCEGNNYYNSDADYDADGCISFIDYQTWYGYYMNQ
jgi:Mg-chelatase subunit ChlD